MVQPLGFRSHVKAFREYIDFPYCVGRLDAIIADPLAYEDQIVADDCYENRESHLTVCHGAYAMHWLGTYQAIMVEMLPERFDFDYLEARGKDTEQRQWALETLETCIETAARRADRNCFISFDDGDVFICKHIETFLPNKHIPPPSPS